MGDPKKQRKKYQTPGHPWQKSRIEEEKQLMSEYGFKNKKGIWRHVAFLRDATNQAKKLVTLSGEQAEKEKALLLDRLRRFGLLTADAGLDAILSISLRDVLERRLQTVVYKKGFSNSVKQARQFITHGHITVNGRAVTSPSYLVSLKEEAMVSFLQSSSLSNEEHPERAAAINAKNNVVDVVSKENEEDSKVSKDRKTKQVKKKKNEKRKAN